jgi:hypothetical protein
MELGFVAAGEPVLDHVRDAQVSQLALAKFGQMTSTEGFNSLSVGSWPSVWNRQIFHSTMPSAAPRLSLGRIDSVPVVPLEVIT